MDLTVGRSFNQGIARCQHQVVSFLRPHNQRNLLTAGVLGSSGSRDISASIPFTALVSPFSSAMFGFLVQCLWLISHLNNLPVFCSELPLLCPSPSLAPPSQSLSGLPQWVHVPAPESPQLQPLRSVAAPTLWSLLQGFSIFRKPASHHWSAAVSPSSVPGEFSLALFLLQGGLGW